MQKANLLNIGQLHAGGGITKKYVAVAVATDHVSSFLGLQLPKFENLVQLHV